MASKTRTLKITSINPPHVDCETSLLEWFNCNKDRLPQKQVNHLLEAAHALQTSSKPVAFPTETVYGLGADATRPEAVRGIYIAKERPSDNPLIVHVGSLDQLRHLLRPPRPREDGCHSHSPDINHTNGVTSHNGDEDDPIPSIYHPLIQRFWPGPLTLLFPLATSSTFAKEVTSSLPTVGIRMPSSPLARLLISLSDRPIAAPSANASTRPSPTTAAHVLHDLDGRIEMILDGGGCEVGVESTVVDGLCFPPAVLRPGGVGIEEIRSVGGDWANVTVGYQDWAQESKQPSTAENGDGGIDSEPAAVQTDRNSTNSHVCGAPRAPGMKYRHYAPQARVHLFEEAQSETSSPSEDHARAKAISYCKKPPAPQPAISPKIGIITTKTWRPGLGFPPSTTRHEPGQDPADLPCSDLEISHFHVAADAETSPNQIYSVSLGRDVEGVARGLFSALRVLDGIGCHVILIEGIADSEGELAAAVMNRLRKAADG